jgi:DNA-binding transcriptional LysR family regulator
MTSMIDRYLIRYCLGVVDQGSFSAAAASARVTQPTLSAGIAKLEALLGQQLFDRSGRRVRLTEAGTRFVDHARRIEAEFAAAERAVQATPPHRLIRIGVAPTVSTIALGAALAAARAAAPDERIEIVEGRTSELQGKLDHGRIDALLGPGVARDGEDVRLFEEGYGVAMATAHPLAHRASVTAEDIAGETMIVRRQCEALPLVSRFFTARGVRPFMAARTVSDDRAAAYVAAGLGITVMPYSLRAPGVAMPALAGFELTRVVGVRVPAAARARLAPSGAWQAFVAGMRHDTVPA